MKEQDWGDFSSFCVGVWCRGKVVLKHKLKTMWKLLITVCQLKSLLFWALPLRKEPPCAQNNERWAGRGGVSLGQGALPAIKSLKTRRGEVGRVGNSSFIFSSSLNGSWNAIQRRLRLLKRAHRSVVSMTDFSFQSFLLRDVGWSWELIDGLGGGCG